MRTVHKRTAYKILATAAAAIIGGTGLALVDAHEAKGDTSVGCETIRWGFLGSQWRTICDGPRREDGSWTRSREIQVSSTWTQGSCSLYLCIPGYRNQGGTVAKETYVVHDHTVLPDEPGWLPPGTDIIR